MNRYKFFILLFVSILFFSCEKDYLDINDNPNEPTDVPNYIMLPAAQLSLTGMLPTQIGISCALWTQYVTQNPTASQWKEKDRFSINFSDFEGVWNELYSGGLNDFYNIKIKASEEDDKAMFFIATVMEVLTYQYLVDLWGDVPYTEACKEKYPSFDKGADIYASLITSLEDILKTTPADLPSSISNYDLIFAGKMSKWIKFAKTLKLRLLIRQYKISPDNTKIGALLADQLLDFDAGVVAFVDADGQRNPLNEYNFHALNTSNNLIASSTMLEYLKMNNDPRYKRFYSPIEGVWYSVPQADFNNPLYSGSDKPKSILDVRATDPVFFISEAESYFLQAEAYLRLNNGVKAKEMYDKGVKTALEFYSIEDYYLVLPIDGSDYTKVGGVYEFNSSGTFEEKLEQIITQKWLALREGVNFAEGFIERSRTGYPKVSDKTFGDAGYVYGQLVMPVGAFSDVFPTKFPSSKSEKTNNPNAPDLVDAFTKIWWSK